MGQNFESVDFVEHITELCHDFFSKLPKTGKPATSKEWTVLTCVVKSDSEKLEVVSLGTGSKCIGKNKMSTNGDILNDCHSEIIARRAFLRYLYEQIQRAFESSDSIFKINELHKCVLGEGILFHLFSTQTPCGDASIIEKDNSHSTQQESSTGCKKFNYKRHIEEFNFEIKQKKVPKLYNEKDVYDSKTGAKCILYNSEDDYSKNTANVLGQVRRKPGKGDQTLSLSCSDKIARWIRVGMQGALVDMLVAKPIALHSITIAGGCPFKQSSMHRGLVDRNITANEHKNCSPLHSDEKINDCLKPLVIPVIRQSSVNFEFQKTDDKKPCPSSIIWCKVKEKPLEIAIDGKKQGVTKKNASDFSSALLISKRLLFKKFLTIIFSSVPSLKTIIPESNSEEPEKLTYKYIKCLSISYYKRWNNLKAKYFGIWTVKPDLLNFSI